MPRKSIQVIVGSDRLTITQWGLFKQAEMLLPTMRLAGPAIEMLKASILGARAGKSRTEIEAEIFTEEKIDAAFEKLLSADSADLITVLRGLEGSTTIEESTQPNARGEVVRLKPLPIDADDYFAGRPLDAFAWVKAGISLNFLDFLSFGRPQNAAAASPESPAEPSR